MTQRVEQMSVVEDSSDHLPVSASPSVLVNSSARRFSVHVLWTVATRLLMVFNSVLAGVLVAHWLGAEGLGQLAVINVTVTMVVQLGSLGLPSATARIISRNQQRLAPATVNAIVAGFIAGSFWACLVILLASVRPNLFNSIEPQLIAIAAISVPFQLVSLIALNIFLALGRILRFNFLDLAGQSLILVNAILAIFILRKGLEMLVSLNTVGACLLAFLTIWLIRRHAANQNEIWHWWPDSDLFRGALRYGAKFHISIVASMLILRADLMVVNYFRGAAEAGVYSVASQVALMLNLVPGVIATLLFPRIAARREERGETTCLVTRHVALIMFLLCVVSVPLSFALPLLYGSGFADAPIQLIILLPGIFLLGLESVLVQHFSALGLPAAVPSFWVATLIVNIVLILMLVPAFGARGAALASSISYAMIFLLVLLYFRFKTGNQIATILVPRVDELRGLVNIRKSAAP